MNTQLFPSYKIRNVGKFSFFVVVAVAGPFFIYSLQVKTRFVNTIWRFQELYLEAMQGTEYQCPFKDLNNTNELLYKIRHPTYKCYRWTKFGGFSFSMSDGQKWVCLDQQMDIDRENCVVYSFGINNEWSFDDQMAKFGCKVYSFDPTMNVDDFQRSPKVAFYNLGISDITGTTKIRNSPAKVARMEDIRKKLGHETTKVDYLKVDVEGSEIKMINDIFTTSPQILTDYVGQIGMEIHIGTSQKNALKLHRKFWELMSRLECLGFELAHKEPNIFAKGNYYDEDGSLYRCCYELVWVNTKLLL